ncbi:hypothetical protein Mapa_003388 [Marchantia paleacea]|nr:hypothetical protein Mapa_003388 [Marchantia paleacea]
MGWDGLGWVGKDQICFMITLQFVVHRMESVFPGDLLNCASVLRSGQIQCSIRDMGAVLIVLPGSIPCIRWRRRRVNQITAYEHPSFPPRCHRSQHATFSMLMLKLTLLLLNLTASVLIIPESKHSFSRHGTEANTSSSTGDSRKLTRHAMRTVVAAELASHMTQATGRVLVNHRLLLFRCRWTRQIDSTEAERAESKRIKPVSFDDRRRLWG